MAKRCVELWARRPGEREEAYAAFLVYRDMGVERSIERVKRSWGETRAKSDAQLFRWSSKHEWVARSRAWDNHLQAERDRVALQEAAKWKTRELKSLELDFQLGVSLKAKALEILKLPSATGTARDAALIARHGADLTTAAIAAALGPKAESHSGDGPQDANSGMRPDVAEAACRAIAEASGVVIDED